MRFFYSQFVPKLHRYQYFADPKVDFPITQPASFPFNNIWKWFLGNLFRLLNTILMTHIADMQSRGSAPQVDKCKNFWLFHHSIYIYLSYLIQIVFPSTVAWCYTEVHFPRFVEIRPDVLNVVINPWWAYCWDMG